MHSNFNSTTATQYTLICSNEAIENELPDNEPSSAPSFQVRLVPSLNLNELAYMKSAETEVRLSNLSIDSLPMTFASGEFIESYVILPPSLGRDNMMFDPTSKANANPLKVDIGDFYAANENQAINHVNTILQNSTDVYILSRLLELFLDKTNIFQSTLFDKLDIDHSAVFSREDCDLLWMYTELAVFSRLEMIKILMPYAYPDKNITDIININKITLTNWIFRSDKEDRILKKSKTLTLAKDRDDVNPDHPELSGKEDLLRIINPKDFNNTNISIINDPRLNTARKNIKTALIKYLNLTSKIPKDQNPQNTLPANRVYLQQMISDNVFMITIISQKIKELIYFEKEKLKDNRATNLLSTPFISLTMDISKLKCKFLINRNKNIEKMSFKIVFSDHISYKLGSSKNIETGKFHNITVGPISVIPTDECKKFGNDIVHENQRLPSCLRIYPKLLCIGINILADCTRKISKELFLFEKDDLIIFFSMELKKPKTNTIVLASSENYKQEFYRVHQARTILSTFKIGIFDENGIEMNFQRQTIVNLALTFRPTILNHE